MRGIVAAAIAASIVTIPGGARAQDAAAAEREVRRCAEAPLRTAEPLARAAACADEFIIRNGYTDLPADADSTRWAAETDERSPRAQWPQSRRGSIERRPLFVCRPRQLGGPDYIVVFTTPSRSYFRAVTLKSDFTRLRVEHRALNPMWLSAPGSRCTAFSRVSPAPGDSAAVPGGPPRPK